MPTPTVMTIISGSLSVGPVGGPLVAYDCQVVSAALIPQPRLQTVAATFCAGEAQAPGATGWQLDVRVLQDWSADATSFTWWSIDHDAELCDFELVLDTGVVAPGDDAVTMNGQAYVVAFQFGGDAGTPLEATQTWPMPAKPIKGAYVPLPLADVEREAPADADAVA